MAASFQPPSHLFERNISLNDLDLALNVREVVRKDVVVPEEATKHRHLGASTSYSFVLPSFQNLEEEFRKFVFSFLVDGHILRELETTRRLNWCSSLCRLVTVNTLGDGNCLMHAASIAMWAVNDRYQTLRRTVYEALVEDVEGFYHSRWKSEELNQMAAHSGGYERTEEQWAHEWEEVIRHASQTEFPLGPSGAQFGSLEEIHIFVLANVLRRTIIVLSDETLRGVYDESYAPINFGGVYLPLLWDSVDCVKSPLVIGYADGHFTAVVSIKDGKLDLDLESSCGATSTNCIHAVPLVKHDGAPLPVHFLLDYEEPLASDRLRQYLDCAKVPFPRNPGERRPPVLVAKLHFAEEPQCLKDLVEGYFAKAREEYQRVSRQRQLSPPFQPGSQQPALQIVQCQTPGCDFFGSTETGNRCSKCLNEYLRTLGAGSTPSPRVPTRQTSTGQRRQPPGANATASSMTLPLTSGGKCRTTGCKYAAIPEQNGLCERCFDAERSAEELAASMNVVSLASAVPCANRVNGCQFFGLPEHHNLCSRCYRAFCLRMENSLGVGSPTGLSPGSPTATMAVLCQTPGCQFQGIPALYGMCVQCYTGCIHNFITSEGRSVGSASPAVAHLSTPLLPPPQDVTNKTQLTRTKGVLCASPGCLNEGVFQYSDLCAECHGRKSGPAPQMRKNPGPVSTTAASVHFTGTQSLPSTASPTVSVTPTLQQPPQTSVLRQRRERHVSGSSDVNPEARSQLPRRPLDVINTASSTAASVSTAQMAPGFSTAPVRPVEALHLGTTTVAAASAAPVPQVRCTMGCREPAVQESGLCEQCYLRALELELNREPVPPPSRQQKTAVVRNQVQQRTANLQPSSSENMQQTEQLAKKAGSVNPMPCNSQGCLNFGTPDKNGLCEACFLKKGNARRTTTSASSFNTSQGFTNSSSLYGTQPMEQSRQFGNSAHSSSSTLQHPVQVCQSQSPHYQSAGLGPFHNVQGLRCRGTNCTLFGTPEMNGYCSQCFLESTIPQSGPCSVPDFPNDASSQSRHTEISLPVQ